MTQPARVIGFLDLAHWDPSLLVVMCGALVPMFIAWRIRRRMDRPLLDTAFREPGPARVDARLVGGAILFGIGWGLGGFCPGPAIASLGAAATPALILVPSMAVGMLLYHVLDKSFAKETR
jgi:uncharacterized membrane protein YedE/YeeE